MKLLRRFSFPLVSLSFAFFVSVLAVSSIPQVVMADAVTGSDKQQGVAALAERWLRYRAVAGCYTANDVERQVYDKISAGTWLDRGVGTDFRVAIGYLDSDGKVSCGDGSFITNSIREIGFASNVESFCSMSTAIRDGKKNYTNCTQGSGEFDMDGSKEDQFTAFGAAVGQRVSDRAQFPYTGNGQIKYWVGLKSLIKFCGGKKGAKLTSGETGNVGDSTRQVVVSEVDLGTGKSENYIYSLTKEQSDTINDVWSNKGIDNGFGVDMVNSQDLTCAQLAKLTRDNAGAFGSFVNNYNQLYPEDAGQEGRLAGEDGDEAGDSKTTCAVDGVGWIVCPVMTFLGRMNDLAFGFINNFLEIKPALITDQAARDAWAAFRNIANIAFVIAFLIIIYSQLTGVGINNYGIKRLLPKLVIAAILVNVSFWICAIVVDISNIVGSSLYTLLESGVVPGDSFTDEGGGGTLSTVWSEAIAGVLVVTAAIGLIVLIVTTPTALLAFGLVILILIARQALVLLLIVVSPLAFVAYLLPNTEDWFKRWWKALSATLLVYPIIALVFGMSTLASTILIRISEDGPGGGDDEQMMKIIAAVVLAVPLFAVPALLKGSLSAAGSIGGKIAGLQDRANRGMARSVKEGRLGEAKNAFDRRGDLRKINRRRGDSYLAQQAKARFGEDSLAHRATTLQSRFDRSGAGRYLGGDRGAAAAVAQYDKAFQEDVAAANILQKDLKFDDRLAIATTGELNGRKVSEAQRVASLSHVMDNGNFVNRKEVLESVSGMGKRELQTVSDGYYKAGLQGVFGAGLGDTIAQGGAVDLNAAATKVLKDGKLKAETLVDDADMTSYVADIATSGKASGSLTPAEIAAVKDAATIAKTNPSLEGKRNNLVVNGLDRLENL